jgi:hypothetical protein
MRPVVATPLCFAELFLSERFSERVSGYSRKVEDSGKFSLALLSLSIYHDAPGL